MVIFTHFHVSSRRGPIRVSASLASSSTRRGIPALAERDGKRVEEILKRQIQEGLKEVSPRHFPDLVVAYEPLWAIGTGRTAKPEQAQRTHAFIRSVVALISDHSTAEQVRIQYGGSVKPENPEELSRQPDIDGALVGGASLDARSFAQIIRKAVGQRLATEPPSTSAGARSHSKP